MAQKLLICHSTTITHGELMDDKLMFKNIVSVYFKPYLIFKNFCHFFQDNISKFFTTCNL